MHDQSRFLSAPVLCGLAIVLSGITFLAEFNVRQDESGAIVRAISSDDQQEIERSVESDLNEDRQTELLALVQDSSLSPLTSDKLYASLLFRTAEPGDRVRFASHVGKLLAKRKRHAEALDILTALSEEQRIEHGSSFSYAQSYRGAGNIEAAISAYATHVAAHPNHNPGYVNYGILLAETGQHEEAVRVFERSSEITSSSRRGKSLSLLGQSQMALGNYPDAIASFDRSIQFRPDNGPTWRRFATAKSLAGTYPTEEVEADYRRALALEPDSAETLQEWAEYYFSLGRFEQAMPMFREASGVAAKDFDILFSRSANLLASERPRAAREIVRRMATLEMSPERSLLLAGLQEASGVIRPPTAETRDEVCDARSGNQRLVYICVLLQLELGEMEAAISLGDELPATSKFTQPAAFALARYEYRQGAADSASGRLDALLLQNPQSPLFWFYKARALSVLEANEEALEAFTTAASLNPESRKIAIEFSQHLSNMEAFEAAEQVLVEFSSRKPNDVSILIELARIHVAAGVPEKAEETLLQLLTMSEEDDAELIEQLVAVQVALEKYPEALVNADNLLEQDPANIGVRELRVAALLSLGMDEEAEAESDRIRRLTPASETGEPAATEIAAVAP